MAQHPAQLWSQASASGARSCRVGTLADARRALVEVEAGQVRPSTEVKSLEEALRDGSLPAGAERDVPIMISRLKAQLAQAQREEQRLRAQETELAAQVDTESSRWSFFNERLTSQLNIGPLTTPSMIVAQWFRHGFACGVGPQGVGGQDHRAPDRCGRFRGITGSRREPVGRQMPWS